MSTLIYGGALLRMTLLDAFLTLITSFKFPSPTDANSISSVRTVKCCKRKIWNNISIFRTSPFNDKSINQSLLFYGCVESSVQWEKFPIGPAILIAEGGGCFYNCNIWPKANRFAPLIINYWLGYPFFGSVQEAVLNKQ